MTASYLMPARLISANSFYNTSYPFNGKRFCRHSSAGGLFRQVIMMMIISMLLLIRNKQWTLLRFQISLKNHLYKSKTTLESTIANQNFHSFACFLVNHTVIFHSGSSASTPPYAKSPFMQRTDSFVYLLFSLFVHILVIIWTHKHLAFLSRKW